MHATVHRFIAETVPARGPFRSVLEVGSRNVNGAARPFFGETFYVGTDVASGPGVDIVMDGASPAVRGSFDCVCSFEVFEHTPHWRAILREMVGLLEVGGLLLITCASPEREPHSAVDGGVVRIGEYYDGVDIGSLRLALASLGLFAHTEHDSVSGDIRILGKRKPLTSSRP